jgi:hypothetical protein
LDANPENNLRYLDREQKAEAVEWTAMTQQDNPQEDLGAKHKRKSPGAAATASAKVTERSAKAVGDAFQGTMAFLREAITAVPSVKYALGVGGVAAVISIVAGFLDLRVALVGIPICFVLMVILVVFSHLAGNSSNLVQAAAVVLIWFSVVAMILVTAAFALTFFVRAETLRSWDLKSFYELFNITPAPAVQKSTAKDYISGFDQALGGVTTPEKVAEAIERISFFWRQPEQRKFLLQWRCKKIPMDAFYTQSAKYVFDNPTTVMKDVDLEARYFDSVARCVQRAECEQASTCDYFYTPMDDFRLQYTDYFHQISLLEGRDPMENVRKFIFSCPQPKDSEYKGNLNCSQADSALQ